MKLVNKVNSELIDKNNHNSAVNIHQKMKIQKNLSFFLLNCS